MRKILDKERLTLGTCYYPEHWPKELWREDLTRMLAAGIETIRIAEFAWNKVEPREGEFTYDFFDGFLDLADELGMNVIMGTPTATPPVWLTERYPEVLNARIDGVLYRHGMRRHYNYNSKVYRELSARITKKFAAHYASRKCVIGWQIDNELNCEIADFYSESDTASFREFLKKKYESIDALNAAWGTVFWNQTYNDWDEIYVPRPTVPDKTNPHQTLDYIRFISDSACSFAKLQADIIRRYIKTDDFVTTNGIFGHLDYQRLRDESLDFIAYDSYPNFAYCDGMYDPDEHSMRDRRWSRNLSEVRAISPVFGIMEQQSGANGWNTGMMAPTPRPGQITLWTMQSVAHGADFVSYFRWRTATFGTEMYWHGILDYSGRDNRRLKEITDIGAMFKRLSPVAGSLYEAKVGIIEDYDNIWDAEVDVWHQAVESASQKALFDTLQRTHTPFDYVYVRENTSSDELSKYDVLFWPHPAIMTDPLTELVTEYVKAGGTVVFGCRSAYKDECGRCVMDMLPGKLSALTGVDIPEYSRIAPDAESVTVDWDGDEFEALVFTDILSVAGDEAKCEAVYTSDHYAGEPALIHNRLGKGSAYYYGSAFSDDAVRVFLNRLHVISPYDDTICLPEECELAVRVKDDKKYIFVLNYDKSDKEIELKQDMTDMLSGERMTAGYHALGGYGVLVLSPLT